MAAFLAVAGDVWRALSPEFKAERLTLFETFPGEHLGGKPIGRVGGAGEINPSILARLFADSAAARA